MATTEEKLNKLLTEMKKDLDHIKKNRRSV